MVKWYEKDNGKNDIVISSRIRLARNLKKYLFSQRMTPETGYKLTEEVKDTILNFPSSFADTLKFISMQELNQREKRSLIENHVISPFLAENKNPCGVIVNEDETINIMINEEDHIRLQTVEEGFELEKAWELADKIDDLIEERIEYAFHKDYGYLTSCPTNTGTGMRASVMLHLPMLKSVNGINTLMNELSKYGITIRGIYGEGSEPLGDIYQVSNQITLGKSEKEIIDVLKNITEQIEAWEKQLRNDYLKNNRIIAEDRIYRSYGTLAYCKNITSSEAMMLLSDVWIGLSEGIIKTKRPMKNIFNIMMNIQAGNLEKYINKDKITVSERDIKRAEYLNKIFKEE